MNIDLAQALIGAAPADGSADQRALAAALSKRNNLGLLGQLTGDKVIAPTGQTITANVADMRKGLQAARQQNEDRAAQVRQWDKSNWLTERGQDFDDAASKRLDRTTRRGQDIDLELGHRGLDVDTYRIDEGNQTERRGQDITAGTARRGQDISQNIAEMDDSTRRRGQDLEEGQHKRSTKLGYRGQNIDREMTIRGQDLSEGQDKRRNKTIQRGQNMDFQTTNRGLDLTMRGQDIDRELGQRGLDLTERGQNLDFSTNRERLANERRGQDMSFASDQMGYTTQRDIAEMRDSTDRYGIDTQRDIAAQSDATVRRGQDYDYSAAIAEQQAAIAENQQKRVDKFTENFGKQAEKTGIDALGPAMQILDEVMLPYIDKINKGEDIEIPGVGGIQNSTWFGGPFAAMSGREGKENRAKIATVRNILLKLRSGAAVTDPEMARAMEELAQGVWNTDADFAKAYSNFRQVYGAQLRNLTASYAPGIIGNYVDNGGMIYGMEDVVPGLSAYLQDKETAAELGVSMDELDDEIEADDDYINFLRSIDERYPQDY